MARAIVEVTQGTTGREIVVELLDNDGPPGVDGTTTFIGFADERALGVTLKVTTTLSPDTFFAVVRFTVTESALAQSSLNPTDAELHVTRPRTRPTDLATSWRQLRRQEDWLCC